MVKVNNIERREIDIGIAILDQGLMSIIIMCDQRKRAVKRARTYEEYRRCLIEAVPGVQNEPMEDVLRDADRLCSDGFLNLSRITWRESSEKGATMTTTCDAPYAWFRIRVPPIRPFGLFSLHQSTSLPARTCKVEELHFRDTLWCPSPDRLDWASVREFYWEFVRREGPEIKRPSEYSILAMRRVTPRDVTENSRRSWRFNSGVEERGVANELGRAKRWWISRQERRSDIEKNVDACNRVRVVTRGDFPPLRGTRYFNPHVWHVYNLICILSSRA